MKGIIGFEDYAVSCIIGVFEEERKQEQIILVDLKVQVDIAKGVKSDSFQEAYDYVQLANLCTEMAQKHKFNLLETLAYHILEKLNQDPQVFWAWIKIKKPSAIPLAKHTFIELEIKKKEVK